MSFDKLLRETIRQEVDQAVRALRSNLESLTGKSSVIFKLAEAFGASSPRRAASVSVGAPRRGRKSKSSSAAKADNRICALIGCGRNARSKGYCAAHYQKFRMLQKTGRLPSDWKEHAPPNSVANITLPRGRASANAEKKR